MSLIRKFDEEFVVGLLLLQGTHKHPAAAETAGEFREELPRQAKVSFAVDDLTISYLISVRQFVYSLCDGDTSCFL